MKRLLLLATIALVVFSCKQETPPAKAILTGKITNTIGDFATISLNNKIDSSYFNNDSLFRFDIDIKKGSYCVFKQGHEITTLFIAPGDSIYMTLNTDMFDESIIYSGKGAKKNNYLVKKFLDNEKLGLDYKTLYSLSSDSFLLKIDSSKNAELSSLEKFEKEANPDKDFIEFEKNKIKLENAISKLNYPSYYAYFTKQEAKINNDWYAFVNDFDVNDSKLNSLPDFDNFFNGLVEYKAKQLMESDSVLSKRLYAKTAAKFNIINKMVKDKLMKNKYIYDIMDEKVKYSSINNIEKLFADFSNFCSDSTYIAKIDSSLKLWTNLAEGLPAPDFKAIDINGKVYKLSDFRGKYVYIDVWATWCGPCLREAPFLEKIEEEFAKNNITFLSISIDNTQEPWKEFLKKGNSHGLQLYAEGAWKSTLAKEYLIHSIPRFMLFDKEGKIIDVRAARPSGNIDEIIKSLDGI